MAALTDAEAASHPIHVTRRGTAGPRVLLIHGGVQGSLGGGTSSFAKQLPLAGQGWQLELVDRPGFGQSPSRGDDDMAADAVWIAGLLGDAAHLIGHSWGGAGALLAAARRPASVQSLILVEPALHPLLAGHLQPEHAAPVQADARRTASLLLAATSPGDYAVAFANSLATPQDAGNVTATAWRNDPQMAARIGCALLRARMASPDTMQQAAEAVARAKIPVLVITGGWSPSFDAVADITARLTHGRHTIVPAPNHFVQLAAADAFNQTVAAFMGKPRG